MRPTPGLCPNKSSVRVTRSTWDIALNRLVKNVIEPPPGICLKDYIAQDPGIQHRIVIVLWFSYILYVCGRVGWQSWSYFVRVDTRSSLVVSKLSPFLDGVGCSPALFAALVLGLRSGTSFAPRFLQHVHLLVQSRCFPMCSLGAAMVAKTFSVKAFQSTLSVPPYLFYDENRWFLTKSNPFVSVRGYVQMLKSSHFHVAAGFGISLTVVPRVSRMFVWRFTLGLRRKTCLICFAIGVWSWYSYAWQSVGVCPLITFWYTERAAVGNIQWPVFPRCHPNTTGCCYQFRLASSTDGPIATHSVDLPFVTCPWWPQRCCCQRFWSGHCAFVDSWGGSNQRKPDQLPCTYNHAWMTFGKRCFQPATGFYCKAFMRSKTKGHSTANSEGINI